MKCYYDNLEYCGYTEGSWQCKTCGEWFCTYHWHDTSQGYCVECAACEYARKEREANKMEEYKCNSAHEWLYDKLRGCESLQTLCNYAITLGAALDSDAIQSRFEKEMDEDGFFDPL
jgi:hypothetical protein